jgi:hypothetical protein
MRYILLVLLSLLTVGCNTIANQNSSKQSNTPSQKKERTLTGQINSYKKESERILFSFLDKAQKPLAETMIYLLSRKKDKTVDENDEQAITKTMGLSMLLDVTKQLNAATNLEVRHFPQQNGSSKKILILESDSSSVNYEAKVANGYVNMVDRVRLASNLDKDEKTILGRLMKSDGNKDHDASVAMYASMGLPNKYIGYLQYPNSDLKFFNSNDGKGTKINSHKDLISTIITGIEGGHSIISMSFLPTDVGLKQLAEFAVEFGLKKESRFLKGEFRKKENRAVLGNLITKKFIWLISLDNELLPSDELKRVRVLDSLRVFQQSVPNIYYVSSTHFNPTSKKGTRDRSAFKEYQLDVLTILSPPVEFKADKKQKGKRKSYGLTMDINEDKYSEFSTSFATPILSTIVHNIWSIMPSLSPNAIADILRETARIEEFPVGKFGHVINPELAYKLVLGRLVAAAYIDSIHPNFTLQSEPDVSSGGQWVLNGTKGISKKEKQLPASKIDVELADVYVSSWQNGIVKIRPIRGADGEQNVFGDKISFCLMDAHYFIDSIEVVISKQYESSTTPYKDETTKKIVISFQDGKAKLVSEYPVKTDAHSGKEKRKWQC